MNDEQGSKHTAVKVDVTSLRLSSSRRHHSDKALVVVISSVTSSREVIATIVQRIGLDAKLAAKVQLVSEIAVRNGRSGSMELILSNDDCPLSVFDIYQKHNVRFRLKWNADSDVIEQPARVLNERNSNHFEHKPRDVPDCDMTSSSRRHQTVAANGSAEQNDVQSPIPTAIGSTGSESVKNSGGLPRLQMSKSTVSNGKERKRASKTSTSSSTQRRSSSFSVTSGENVNSTDVDHRVHQLLPAVDELNTSHRRRGFAEGPEGKFEMRSTSHERLNDYRRHDDPLAEERRHSVDVSRPPPTSGSVSTSQTIGGSGGGRRYERLLNHQTGVSTACRAYSNLAVACSDDEVNNSGDDSSGRGDNEKQANDDEFDDGDEGGRRMSDYKSENRSTTSSIAGDDDERRSLVKFSSLPNIDQLKREGSFRLLLDNGRRKRRRQRRNNVEHRRDGGRLERRTTEAGSADGSDVIGGSDGMSSLSSGSLKSSATSSSRVADSVDASTSSRRRDEGQAADRSFALMAESMPCISSAFGSAGRGGRLPKRFLPSLSITEEDVELKRTSLTRQLSLRLLTAVNRHRHQHGGKSTGSTTSSKEETSPMVATSKDTTSPAMTCVRLRAPKRGGLKKSKRRNQGYATSNDDDVMSVTSREVADILSMAAPMAPLSDEEEQEQPEEDGSHVDAEDEYDEYYYTANHNGGGHRHDDDGGSSGRSAGSHAFQKVASAFDRLAVDAVAHQPRSHKVQVGDRPWVGGRPSSISQMDSSVVRNGTTISKRTAGQLAQLVNDDGSSMMTQWRLNHEQIVVNHSATKDQNGSCGNLSGTTTTSVASLFRLIRSCRLGAVRLERIRDRHNNEHRRQRSKSSTPPFQVVNDSVSLPDDVIDVNGRRRQSTTAISAPVVTVAEVTWSDWLVTSSGEEVLPGDIVVEVNGQLVLGQPAYAVNSMLLSAHRSVTSSILDLVIARRNHSS